MGVPFCALLKHGRKLLFFNGILEILKNLQAVTNLDLAGCQQLASLDEYTFGGPLHSQSGGRQGRIENQKGREGFQDEGNMWLLKNSLEKRKEEVR